MLDADDVFVAPLDGCIDGNPPEADAEEDDAVDDAEEEATAEEEPEMSGGPGGIGGGDGELAIAA